MKLKAVARVVLRGVLPAVVGLVLLVLVTAWLIGAFTKKIPAGSVAATGGGAAVSPGQETYEVREMTMTSRVPLQVMWAVWF